MASRPEGKDLTQANLAPGEKQAAPAASEGVDASDLREAILALAAARGADKTICPSEVARHFRGADETRWRLLMRPIRAEAVRLAEEGRLVVKRKGKAVDPHDFKGVYRLAVPDERS